MKMLSLDDAIKAVTMLLDYEDDTDLIWSCDVINNLKNAPSVVDAEPTQKWISVKDRLPEEPGRYLCWFGKNTFAVGASIVPYIPDLHWFASMESLERYENVTHWMPLPKPPKEQREATPWDA